MSQALDLRFSSFWLATKTGFVYSCWWGRTAQAVLQQQWTPGAVAAARGAGLWTCWRPELIIWPSYDILIESLTERRSSGRFCDWRKSPMLKEFWNKSNCFQSLRSTNTNIPIERRRARQEVLKWKTKSQKASSLRGEDQVLKLSGGTLINIWSKSWQFYSTPPNILLCGISVGWPLWTWNGWDGSHLSPSQTPTNQSSRFFSEPKWKVQNHLEFLFKDVVKNYVLNHFLF